MKPKKASKTAGQEKTGPRRQQAGSQMKTVPQAGASAKSAPRGKPAGAHR